MKITNITYRRSKNLGNYESETLEVSAEIEDGDSTNAAYETLRGWVNHKLNIAGSHPNDDDDIPEDF